MNIKIFKDETNRRWGKKPGMKALQYLGQFFNRTISKNKIKARVEGNFGTYTVSIILEDKDIKSTCSCYIGKEGYCHHCEALAYTYLNEPESFKKNPVVRSITEKTPESIKNYLENITLESILERLKEKGITQKEFAEMIGMNPRKLAAIKSSELRNRYYNELGAVKLACLWIETNIKKVKKVKKVKKISPKYG
ncbi:MAG: hypothetical protein Q8933_18385 [Bacteroidota bacterium]|nr:hypothetical protein [Bacteroidota bacterium]